MQELLTLLAIVLGILAVALAAVLHFRARNLALRQKGIVDELQEVSAAQRRVLEQFHGIAQKQKALAEKIGTLVNAGAEGESKSSELDSKAVKEDVLFLARQGLSAEKIAIDLSIPKGEVELILDLDRFRSQE